MEVRIETLEPMRVAFIRHTGPYSGCGKTWEELGAWAGPRGLFMRPGVLMLGLGYDDPETTPPEEIRYDACITVGDDVEGDDRVKIQTLPGGCYATLTHRGSYERLAESYGHLCGTWFESSGKTMRQAPCVEIYRNSAQDTAEEDLITDIYLPIEA